MAKLRFNANTPLYTSDATAWRIDQLPQLLHRLSDSSLPIVLFVHGRGDEPNKSLRGATWVKGLAVHKIERGYDAQVLMFNWDSDFPGVRFRDRDRPLSHAEPGARVLTQVLQGLDAWQAANPNARKPALLAHSMGTIVLQKAVEGGVWPFASPLFSSVLLSQPDADDIDHHVWLDRLASRERVYVTLNADDRVLLKSKDARPAGARALGLGTNEPLAQQATYVDLTNMGPTGDQDDDHEVFGKGAMNGQIYVCEFFTQVLTGRAVVLDRTSNVEGVDRKVVFKLKNRHQPGAPCLKVPDLPGH